MEKKEKKQLQFRCLMNEVPVEGSPIGSKGTVFKWVVKHYGIVSMGLMDAAAFFSAVERINYVTKDGRLLVLEEVPTTEDQE